MTADARFINRYFNDFQSTTYNHIDVLSDEERQGLALSLRLMADRISPEPATTPDDPMHQLAHGFPLPGPFTLSDLESTMKARHAAGECGMLPCPECRREA